MGFDTEGPRRSLLRWQLKRPERRCSKLRLRMQQVAAAQGGARRAKGARTLTRGRGPRRRRNYIDVDCAATPRRENAGRGDSRYTRTKGRDKENSGMDERRARADEAPPIALAAGVFFLCALSPSFWSGGRRAGLGLDWAGRPSASARRAHSRGPLTLCTKARSSIQSRVTT